MKAKMTVYKNGGKTPIVPDPRKKMTDMEIAKANRMDMLTQERNTIRKYDPAALPAFDRGLKEQGFMVKKKPAAAAVKKMMGGGKMDMTYLKGGKVENKIKRLENREANLVARGNKAVDEGRERKADRLLGRAARVENRVIKAKESAPVKKMAGGGKMNVDGYYGKGGKMDTYGMGGKMKKYLMGGQVKLDKNKDGKISAVDFKMLKKK